MEDLNDTNGVSFIQSQSFKDWVIVFKHSKRCSISSMSLSRFTTNLAEIEKEANVYLLDLIKFRNISNELAAVFNVQHESPQILIINKGECVYNASHFNIKTSEIIKVVSSPNNN
jgi:bacillithiol system protein YtxJ